MTADRPFSTKVQSIFCNLLFELLRVLKALFGSITTDISTWSSGVSPDREGKVFGSSLIRVTD